MRLFLAVAASPPWGLSSLVTTRGEALSLEPMCDQRMGSFSDWNKTPRIVNASENGHQRLGGSHRSLLPLKRRERLQLEAEAATVLTLGAVAPRDQLGGAGVTWPARTTLPACG
jgi:hypothetical protein